MAHDISEERMKSLKEWNKDNKENGISTFYMEREDGFSGQTCALANGVEDVIINGLIGWLVQRTFTGPTGMCIEELIARIKVRYYEARRAFAEEAEEEDND